MGLRLGPRLQKVCPRLRPIKMTKRSCLYFYSTPILPPIDAHYQLIYAAPRAGYLAIVAIGRLQKVIESKFESFRKRLRQELTDIEGGAGAVLETQGGLESRANLCVKILPDLQSHL